MKIEMVVPSMVTAGMEMVVADLSRSLIVRGHAVGITCLQSRGALGAALEAEGLRVSVVAEPGIRAMLRPRRLTRWFRSLAPDVVHAHSGTWLKAARAGWLADVPAVIHTMHGIPDHDPWHRPWVERWAASRTNFITVVSEPMREYTIRKLRVDPARVRILHNGVNTSRFQPGPRSGEIRKRFNLDADRLIIGHVARFQPVKNHELLLAAFARVHEACPQAFLALIGDGPLREPMEQRAASLGIRAHTGFFGPCMDTAPLYRDFDVFVLPSLLEQTSMSILEAMATGLPVVATDVGGTPELLDRGQAGVLVPSQDVEALTAALQSLLMDRQRREEVGRRARARVLEYYDHERIVREYESIYRELVA